MRETLTKAEIAIFNIDLFNKKESVLGRRHQQRRIENRWPRREPRQLQERELNTTPTSSRDLLLQRGLRRNNLRHLDTREARVSFS